jgi:hypothetical protein
MIILGADLGQLADQSALTAIKTIPRPGLQPFYDIFYLKKFPLRTSYMIVAQEIKRVMEIIAKQPEGLLDLNYTPEEAQLVVDASGVGRPVVDYFHTLGVYCLPVTITGGSLTSQSDDGGYHVPKMGLISSLQILFQTGRIKLPKAQTQEGKNSISQFVEELQNFKMKKTRTKADTAESQGKMHDDLILSAALAAWWSMQCAGDSFEDIKTPKPEDVRLREAEIAYGLKQKEEKEQSLMVEDWDWKDNDF